MLEKRVTVNGADAVYFTSGRGNALVLIHGFGFDARIWEPLLPALEQHANVIRVELPGFGGSDLPQGEPTIDAYADAVAAVMQNENIESANVIGHSMGGYVALNLLERYNALVEGIGLLHSHPFADDAARKEKRLKDAEFIERNGPEKFIPVLIPALFGDAFKEKHVNVINGLVERYKSLDANGLVYALKAMESRPTRSEALRNAAKPPLLIAGGQDAVVSLEMVSRIQLMSSQTYTLLLRDAGHMGLLEETKACSSIIRCWSDKLSNW